MNRDINPYRSLSADISPTEFEIFCMNTLQAYAIQENLKNFSVSHNQKVESNDGTYQIDVLGEFTIMGTKVKMIVECKKYSRAIEREKICSLYQKQQSLGANKSIFMSTSGYQSGAVMFAKAHGITLIQIVDEFVKYIQNSIQPNLDILKIQMFVRRQVPNYFALQWDLDSDYPYNEIYPTKEMYKNVIDNIKNTMFDSR